MLFYHYRNPVQRAPRAFLLAFPVEFGSDCQSIGVQFDDGAQSRAGLVNFRKALQEGFTKFDRSQFPAIKLFLQFGNTIFRQLQIDSPF
jgi:hypothetical protein